MDAVRPDAHVVRGGQVTVHERGVVGLPLRGQPRHRCGRQAGRGAEELFQRGHELAGGQAVLVEQWQHFADLQGLPAPGRQDRRGEPLALPGRLVDALGVHPWGPDLDRPGGRRDPPRLVVAVAHDLTATAVVQLVGQLGYVAVDFRFQRGGQHPPSALADDLVDQGAVLRGTVRSSPTTGGEQPGTPTVPSRTNTCARTARAGPSQQSSRRKPTNGSARSNFAARSRKPRPRRRPKRRRRAAACSAAAGRRWTRR